MAWVYFNPNPWGLNTDDCTVRALCSILRINWDEAHKLLWEHSDPGGRHGGADQPCHCH